MTCVHVPSQRSRQPTFSLPRLLLGFLLPISPILAMAETLPLHDNGAVAVWTVAGPFPNDPARAGLNMDFLKPSGGESQASPAEGDMIQRPQDITAVWQTAFGTGSGELDFTDLFRNAHLGHSVAYAFCQLESVEPQRVILLIRHRAGCSVWLNGQLAYFGPGRNGADVNENRVPVSLVKGANPLLCKIDQVDEPWNLTLAVKGLTGEPVKGVSSVIKAAHRIEGQIYDAAFVSMPLVRKNAAGERWVVAATIDSGGVKGASLLPVSEGWLEQKPHALADLPLGRHKVEFDIPALIGAHKLSVQVISTNGQKVFADIALKPPRQWTVYLTQHTHTDIGYTRPQTEILPEHLRYIDYALDYCDLTDAAPDDARFRWTCETSWAVREYLKRRPAEQIERLKRRVKEGRIEIAGMLLNMSEIATESSLAASLQPIRDLNDIFGVPVRTAMQNDVNGAGWCLVDYFSDIGLKYLTMGINKTRSLLPFNQPTAFWWESPSGKRILAYRSDHYMTANFWQINQGRLDKFEPGVVHYLQSLASRGYPFDRVGVQYSGYFTDNSPPSTIGTDVVQKWNEAYAWPHLRLATAQEFLAYVEKEHGAELEVHRQAWPDWWTDGFGSAARETAASREIHSAMQVNETLLAMLTVLGGVPAAESRQRAARIQDDLLFYDEHTYGAAESISDPLAENSQVQWMEKSAYVWTAVKEAKLLREEALGQLQDFLPREDRPTIAVFNTLNWERSGLVTLFIDHEILPPDREFRLIDRASGETVAAQLVNSRAEGAYWALWVNAVPSLGYKVLRLETGPGPRPAVPPFATKPDTLANSYYTLMLDGQKGALSSLIDNETGQELVDRNCAWGFGQCFYETLPGTRDFARDAFRRTAWRNVLVRPGANGPIWQSLLLSGDMDGCQPHDGVKLEVRLYQPEKRVEFHFSLRKLPITEAEAVYVAFPFQRAASHLEYEAQGGAITPGKDQIPGSSSDWQTVQSYLAVRNPEGQIVWGSDQAPLVQLGDLNLGKWQPITLVDKPHVYSWVMNNYWFTNFRPSQEGEFKWSYYLTSTKEAGHSCAARFGWGSRIPLIARVQPAGKSPRPSLPLFLSALAAQIPNVILIDAKPAATGSGIVLHLREVEGKPARISPSDIACAAEISRVDEVNVLAEMLHEGIDSLTLKPYETKFVKILFRR